MCNCNSMRNKRRLVKFRNFLKLYDGVIPTKY